ncbi:MAG: glutamate racemase [Bacteroidales bacterium]
MRNNPIGIFDSGVGGLSVLKELAALLPQENICYIGDEAHCPYGSRSPQEVLQLSLNIVDDLLQKGSKIIVVACNTATAAAIDSLRQRFPHISFVGTEPAVKPAALQTQTRNIGILATAGTLQSRLFNSTKAQYASNINVHLTVGEGLVELIENGQEDSPEAHTLLSKHLQTMLNHEVDELVLGCTHYPFLERTIQSITKGKIALLNPAPAIALQTQRLLSNAHLLNENTSYGQYDIYSTGNIETLQRIQKKHLSELTERCFYHKQII